MSCRQTLYGIKVWETEIHSIVHLSPLKPILPYLSTQITFVYAICLSCRLIRIAYILYRDRINKLLNSFEPRSIRVAHPFSKFGLFDQFFNPVWTLSSFQRNESVFITIAIQRQNIEAMLLYSKKGKSVPK